MKIFRVKAKGKIEVDGNIDEQTIHENLTSVFRTMCNMKNIDLVVLEDN